MAQRLHDIQPGEVSLVKRGANRRRFLLAKSGEVEFDETIAKVLDTPAADEAAWLEAVEKAGGDDEVAHVAATIARAWEALPADIRKAMKPQMADEEDENGDGDGDEENGDGSEDDDELMKAAAEYETVLKRDFTDEQRKKLADTGAALPNGSYPIENTTDLRNAIHAIGRGKAPHAQIRAHIIARAKALGAENELPDDWTVNKEDRMTETAQAVPVKKEDGSWDLSTVPEENRPAFEAFIAKQDAEAEELRKAAEEQKTLAEQAIAKAEAVEVEIAKAKHIAAASEYVNHAKSADELGDLLYDIAKAEKDEHLPKGTSDTLTELLKAANEAAADVFKEAGRVGRSNGETDAVSKLDAAADEIRKADSSLSKEQAIAKALKTNPDLYDEYQKAVA